ncbi:branched-chain amino acid ABC transporter permease [uncultured Roseibium sp.]|uniref:branched-chain amino acid ABC transporter permease n=1 Tax=uncultured Roseibium sp. TaxID=1936171 RepID=UPI00374A5233
MNGSIQFALFCLSLVLIVYAVAAYVLRSSFGRTLIGIHSNEDRMRALGLSVWKHKAAAFAFSSLLAGVAGVLAAQHTMFVSPELLVWTVSGEVLIIVILGGLGTLAGPIAGAALLVFLKHQVSEYTEHWHLVIGLFLIAAVMAGGRGVYGQIEHVLQRKSRRSANA